MDRFAQGGSADEVLVKPSCKFSRERVRNIGLGPDEPAVPVLGQEEPWEGRYRHRVDRRRFAGVQEYQRSIRFSASIFHDGEGGLQVRDRSFVAVRKTQTRIAG